MLRAERGPGAGNAAFKRGWVGFYKDVPPWAWTLHSTRPRVPHAALGKCWQEGKTCWWHNSTDESGGRPLAQIRHWWEAPPRRGGHRASWGTSQEPRLGHRDSSVRLTCARVSLSAMARSPAPTRLRRAPPLPAAGPPPASAALRGQPAAPWGSGGWASAGGDAVSPAPASWPSPPPLLGGPGARPGSCGLAEAWGLRSPSQGSQTPRGAEGWVVPSGPQLPLGSMDLTLLTENPPSTVKLCSASWVRTGAGRRPWRGQHWERAPCLCSQNLWQPRRHPCPTSPSWTTEGWEGPSQGGVPPAWSLGSWLPCCPALSSQALIITCHSPCESQQTGVGRVTSWGGMGWGSGYLPLGPCLRSPQKPLAWVLSLSQALRWHGHLPGAASCCPEGKTLTLCDLTPACLPCSPFTGPCPYSPPSFSNLPGFGRCLAFAGPSAWSCLSSDPFHSHTGLHPVGTGWKSTCSGWGSSWRPHGYWACVFHRALPRESGNCPIRHVSSDHPGEGRGEAGDRWKRD